MKKTINAFPQTVLVNNLNQVNEMGCSGMDLRDYFAAKAMQVILHEDGCFGARPKHYMAKDAYTIADAMLTERVKPQGKGAEE